MTDNTVKVKDAVTSRVNMNEDMLAHDKLPAMIREVMCEANYKVSAESVQEFLDEGITIEALRAAFVAFDLELSGTPSIYNRRNPRCSKQPKSYSHLNSKQPKT